MTRPRGARLTTSGQGEWTLQNAKAHLGDVIRKANSEGPQTITVHGHEEVVIVSVDEYRRWKDERTGQALVKVLQESPLSDVSIDRLRARGRVRGVKL